MRFWFLLFGVALLFLGSSTPRDVYVDERTNTEIYFTTQEQMFPRHWYGSKVNAEAEALSVMERSHFIAILNRAFMKYPDQVLRENIDRIFALRKMKFYGLSYGGTNVDNTLFICDDETNPVFTDEHIEGIFHHEFSSVLKRNHGQFFNNSGWISLNPPGFRYGNGGVDAMINGHASMELDPVFFADGFLSKYSQASLEEDINVFAQNLFSGDRSFWAVVDNNIRIRRKARILIGFYQKIDSRFTEEYFRHMNDRVAGKY